MPATLTTRVQIPAAAPKLSFLEENLRLEKTHCSAFDLGSAAGLQLVAAGYLLVWLSSINTDVDVTV